MTVRRRDGLPTAAAVMALLLASSCTVGPVGGSAPGTAVSNPVRHQFLREEVLTVHGGDRTYRMFVPVQADHSQPVPLVVVLHGTGDSGAVIQSFSGYDGLAAREGFLVAYPDSSNGAWNARFPQPSADEVGIADDVAFLVALVDDVARIHPVDRRRVYATGHSSGGRMSYRLVCERPDVFAAAAPVSGGLVAPECSPARPVAVLQVEGENDYTRAEADAGVDALQRVNGCPSESRRERVDSATVAYYGPCRGGVEVAYALVADWGHDWPSGLVFDTAAHTWAFLSRHPAPAAAR